VNAVDALGLIDCPGANCGDNDWGWTGYNGLTGQACDPAQGFGCVFTPRTPWLGVGQGSVAPSGFDFSGGLFFGDDSESELLGLPGGLPAGWGLSSFIPKLSCPAGASFLCGGVNPTMDVIDPNAVLNFIDTLGDCAADQVGIRTVIGLLGSASGAPLIPKTAALGSMGATSLASKFLSKALPYELPFRVLAPTLENPLVCEVFTG